MLINGIHKSDSLMILSSVSCINLAINIAITGSKNNAIPSMTKNIDPQTPAKPNIENRERALNEMLGKPSKIAIEKRNPTPPKIKETIVDSDHSWVK